MANVKFSEGDARRIAAATRAFERGNRDMPPIQFRSAGDDGGQVRIGQVSADWAMGKCATVNVYESQPSCSSTPTYPTANSPAETIEDVRNVSRDVLANSLVVIAQAPNGFWYLIEAGGPPGASCRKTIGGEDFTKWPGYNGSTAQILGHDASGCLKWFDTTSCATENSSQ
jgi:hypothetical protein